MTVKATWDNIELTGKGKAVKNDLAVWKECFWSHEQLVNAGLARITQPVFIDGAEYLLHPLKDLGYPFDGVTFTYDLNTNRFNGPDGVWLSANGFGTKFTVRLIPDLSTVPSAVPAKLEPLPSVGPTNRQHPRNKYDREILPGVHVDVYDVLAAFPTNSSAIDHAVKKLLAPGQRGVKDRVTDLKEAISSIQREIDRIGEWSDRAAGGQISKSMSYVIGEAGLTTIKFKPSREDEE